MTIDYTAQKIRSAISYYGGKGYLCRPILQMSPAHTTYVEPFAGGLSVLLNKFRSDVEVACDVNAELINFYHVLVDTPKLVIEQVKQIPFGRATFEAAKAAGDRGSGLDRAVNFLIRHRMSYAGIGKTWADDNGRNGVWRESPYYLEPVARRLQDVKILLGSAFDVIPEYDSPDTFFYLDPTYYGPTRVNSQMYDYEMSSFDHLRLLHLVKRLQGKVILSGYSSVLYDKELVTESGWERVEKHVALYSSPRKKKVARTEVFWVKT
jgi:DNA adenine methylase